MDQIQNQKSLSTQSKHLQPLYKPISSTITNINTQPKNLILYINNSIIKNNQQLTKNKYHIFTKNLTNNIITSQTTSTKTHTKNKNSYKTKKNNYKKQNKKTTKTSQNFTPKQQINPKTYKHPNPQSTNSPLKPINNHSKITSTTKLYKKITKPTTN